MCKAQNDERARVDPARLTDALNEKLGAATTKLHELREAEQPRMTAQHDPKAIVEHLLTSARSLSLAAETFAKDNWPEGDLSAWRRQWQRALDPQDEQLWHYMRVNRNWADHGDGAGLIPINIPMPVERSHNPSAILLGINPYNPVPTKGGVRFAKYPDVSASEVCNTYLGLCRRYIEDFHNENGAHPPLPAAQASKVEGSEAVKMIPGVVEPDGLG